MKCLKFMLFGLMATAVLVQAGGAASLVGQKSKTKDYKYSWETENYFVKDCSHNANEWVCKCVLKKLQSQYSEDDFLYINGELNNNNEHPEFVDFISAAVDKCDAEYMNRQDSRTGQTILGDRRSVIVDNYSEEYVENLPTGIGDGFAGLLGGGGGGIATKAKGSIKTPSMRDIDMGAGGSRSAADIMKVVRLRTPGLRNIYNKNVKKKPGFQGVVTLRFTIAPEGEIISISKVSSTTDFAEFDNEIKNAVRRWIFSKVKSGNTTVTIPFSFSE